MKILKNQSLLNYNTFKVDVKVREIIFIERSEDFIELLKLRDFKEKSYFILGDGSNVLFTNDFHGTCIKSELKGISRLKENDNHVWLKVESGLNWHYLVRKIIDMGYQGIENLSLIPGTVGAAPVQNIGAYGVEIKQFIEKVEALDLRGGEFFHFDNKDCQFMYRSSIFKTKYPGRFLIKSIILKLNKKSEYNITYEKIKETLEILNLNKVNARNISDAVIHIRKNKLPDPDRIGNAGSFFKNPVIDKTDYEGLKAEFPGIKAFQLDKSNFKLAAAWLIESCGWKGKSFGQAGVYQNQPLVLVNLGNATGKDIFELSEKIQNDVANKFGIILQPEVTIL
jgi:UDP-N-acetylmuramate dehydrogenase